MYPDISGTCHASVAKTLSRPAKATPIADNFFNRFSVDLCCYHDVVPLTLNLDFCVSFIQKVAYRDDCTSMDTKMVNQTLFLANI